MPDGFGKTLRFISDSRPLTFGIKQHLKNLRARVSAIKKDFRNEGRQNNCSQKFSPCKGMKGMRVTNNNYLSRISDSCLHYATFALIASKSFPLGITKRHLPPLRLPKCRCAVLSFVHISANCSSNSTTTHSGSEWRATFPISRGSSLCNPPP